MKKTLLTVAALITVALTYVLIRGGEMKEVRTEIEIAANPTRVWDIIQDVESWEQWSPIISESRGTAAVGSTVNIKMKGKNGDANGPSYKPVITDLKEQSYFHWTAKMLAGFIFTNEKIFELRETESGTHLTHTETFNGLMVPFMSGSLQKEVPGMLNSMNRALKDRAES